MNDIKPVLVHHENYTLPYEAWPLLVTVFLLGSSAGALRILRNKQKPTCSEVTSTALLAGIIALSASAYFIDKGITPLTAIAVSILVGLAADDLVRIVVAGVVAFAKKFFNNDK